MLLHRLILGFLVVLAGAVSTAGAPAQTEGSLATVLPVETHESAESVRLRIRLPPEIEPDSVELELKGREVVVRARSSGGGDLRSGVIVLDEAPTEDGADAQLEDDGLLVVTLQK